MSKPKCKTCKHLEARHAKGNGTCNAWKAAKFGVVQCKCSGWAA